MSDYCALCGEPEPHACIYQDPTRNPTTGVNLNPWAGQMVGSLSMASTNIKHARFAMRRVLFGVADPSPEWDALRQEMVIMEAQLEVMIGSLIEEDGV